MMACFEWSILFVGPSAETKTEVSADVVGHSLQRIKLTTEVSPALVEKAVKEGKDTGFLKGSTDTSHLIESL